MTWIVAIALLIAALGLAALLRRTPRTGLATEYDDAPLPGREAEHARAWYSGDSSLGAPHHPAPAGMSGDATGITLRRCCRMCGRADGHWSGCLLAPKAAGAPLLRSLGADE